MSLIAIKTLHEAVLNGVTHWCIAPGSRSTPLVLAAANHPECKTWVGPDERSLGFLALGMAKALNQPVGVIVTSGTAGANLYPAVIEAYMSGVPLVVFTADRPFDLQYCGANQTILQSNLFGEFTHFSATLPETLTQESSLLDLIDKAISACKTHSGPIHLNCPFSEPFQHESTFTFTEAATTPQTTYHAFPKIPVEAELPIPTKKPLLCIGSLSHQDAQEVYKWVHPLEIPSLVDICAQMPELPYTLPNQNTPLNLLEEADSIIHIGGPLISKSIFSWITQKNLPTLRLQNTPFLHHPHHPKSHVFPLHTRLKNLPKWIPPQPMFHVETSPPQTLSEAWIAHQISTTLPEDTHVFCGNSLPIRALNLYPPKSPYKTLWTNRGASGIDGLISTASGIAHASQEPVMAWVGDLSTLHDLNALYWIRTLQSPFVLLISNNQGGGIFEHLPISQSTHFDRFFKCSHRLNFAHASHQFGIRYLSATTPEEATLQWSQLWDHGPTLFEIQYKS